MTQAAPLGSNEPILPLWDTPLTEMRWDLTAVYSADPAQLSGAALVDDARTYEYATVPGTQLLIVALYQIGVATGITRISLFPEFRFGFTPTTLPIAAVRPAVQLAALVAPCSYRAGADSGLGAVAGTPITPLELRYDRIDLPLNVVDAGQGTGIVSVMFWYPAMSQLVRFRVDIAGGPGVAGPPADILQIHLARGVLRSGVVGGGGPLF